MQDFIDESHGIQLTGLDGLFGERDQIAFAVHAIGKNTHQEKVYKDDISGLSKQRNADTDKGVPGLKDIPVLGWFFKNEGKSDQMQEVLIFITPTILPPQVTAAAGEGADKAGTAGH